MPSKHTQLISKKIFEYPTFRYKNRSVSYTQLFIGKIVRKIIPNLAFYMVVCYESLVKTRAV